MVQPSGSAGSIFHWSPMLSRPLLKAVKITQVMLLHMYPVPSKSILKCHFTLWSVSDLIHQVSNDELALQVKRNAMFSDFFI